MRNNVHYESDSQKKSIYKSKNITRNQIKKVTLHKSGSDKNLIKFNNLPKKKKTDLFIPNISLNLPNNLKTCIDPSKNSKQILLKKSTNVFFQENTSSNYVEKRLNLQGLTLRQKMSKQLKIYRSPLKSDILSKTQIFSKFELDQKLKISYESLKISSVISEAKVN